MSAPSSGSPEPLWREEFPIRSEDERYVTRRQFGRFLVLTSLGMFVGNLWILAKAWTHREAGRPRTRVARVGEIPVGGVKPFRYPGPHDPCLLVRTGPDAYVAYSQTCTHLSCAVTYAPDRRTFECPCHQGSFAVEDGRVLKGPPPRPLPRVLLQREGDDLLAVGVGEGGES